MKQKFKNQKRDYIWQKVDSEKINKSDKALDRLPNKEREKTLSSY